MQILNKTNVIILKSMLLIKNLCKQYGNKYNIHVYVNHIFAMSFKVGVFFSKI